MTKKMEKINELFRKYKKFREYLGIGTNSKKIPKESDPLSLGGGLTSDGKKFSRAYIEQIILKTNKMNEIIKMLQWRYQIRENLSIGKAVFFMDIYHNADIKDAYLTITQIVNSRSIKRAKMKLVFKEAIDSHKWKDIRVVLIKFLKQIRKLDYVLISDRENAWVNMIPKELRNGDLSEQFTYCAGRFFCLRGARNTPYKEPCQPRDPEQIEKTGLRPNSIEILKTWINKQITKLEDKFTKNFEWDSQILQLRKTLKIL
jgi:hypothetical protein